MAIWSAEIKELEKLYESLKGQLPDLEKELEQLIRTEDANVILLYSRRCLEVIITDLCECELKRPRQTEPLKGIIDKLHKERKVPAHIITSMHGLNELSTYGTHPKDFDPEQIKPVLNNLDIIIKWYLKFKDIVTEIKTKPAEEIKHEIKGIEDVKKSIYIPKKRLMGLLSGLILLIMIVIAVLFFTNIIGSGRQTKELEKSIAVLPFINESPVDSNKYFINGIMEEVLTNLQKIKDFRVLSRTSTDQYKGQDRPTITEIAKALGVSYIVEGSGQKYGNTFRLRVQLIKGKGKENHLWAKSYEQELRETESLFGIQSHIAQAVASELKAIITPEEKQIIEKVSTSNMAALDLYMKANDFLKEYEKTRDSSVYKHAVTFYKAALIIDPSYAKAYTGLASAYYDRYQWEAYFEENYLDSMLILANRALSIDDRLDEAYYLKGIYYQKNGQFQEAQDIFDKAININPNNYLAYVAKGGTWWSTDFVESIKSYQKAITLISVNERSSLLKALALIYNDIGFGDKAKQYYKEALELDGDSANYYRNLATIEFSKENFENSILFYERAYKIDSLQIPPCELYNFVRKDQEAYISARKEIKIINNSGELPLYYLHRIGYALWKVGKFKEADYYFKEQIKNDTESIKMGREVASMKSAQYDLAAVYAFLGNKTKAFQYLDDFSTLKIYPLWWISYAKNDPLFASIRNEERYQKILQNIEAKHNTEHERVRKWLKEQGMLEEGP